MKRPWIALEDDEQWVRMSAAEALAKIGEYALDAKNILIDILYDDESDDVRHMAAVALGSIGKEPGVVHALVDAMGDKSVTVRDGAHWALRSLGLEAITGLDFVDNDPVAVLTDALSSDDVETRKYAAFALGEYGADATSALSTLTHLTYSEPDDETRWFCQDAIRKIKMGDGE